MTKGAVRAMDAVEDFVAKTTGNTERKRGKQKWGGTEGDAHAPPPKPKNQVLLILLESPSNEIDINQSGSCALDRLPAVSQSRSGRNSWLISSSPLPATAVAQKCPDGRLPGRRSGYSMTRA